MAVNNLFCVTPSLYRSARLTRRDVPHLQALGIRKVVSFRAFHSDDAILAGSQIAVLRVPINTWRICDKDMIAVLRILRTVDDDGPVLIHCQHGADRTGLVCALYRVVYQGWSKSAALEELRHGGFGFHTIWRNIQRYFERVDIEALRHRIEA
ncbi:dual specificity protein phosphatase family protein [Paraburkholderia sp. J76]|uniref:dual specificity protein phosphatase family protein n=1 Tax=Paraburkholderia sp. J76 TaxID=2805439 RepID=UPI002ABDE216|nr:dual specificity protein phosphatase family protein [Paraburkholderia sp. J76]